MYSPKIDESLIPRIYRAAKAANMPMTVWVSRAVETALPKEANTADSQSLIILEGSNPSPPETLRMSKAQMPA